MAGKTYYIDYIVYMTAAQAKSFGAFYGSGNPFYTTPQFASTIFSSPIAGRDFTPSLGQSGIPGTTLPSLWLFPVPVGTTAPNNGIFPDISSFGPYLSTQPMTFYDVTGQPDTYFWRGSILTANAPVASPPGTNVVFGARRWVQGFEIPGAEGNSGLSSSCVVAASRIPGGFGFAYRSLSNSQAIQNVIVNGAIPAATRRGTEWERFYVRLLTLPVGGEDQIWECFGSIDGGSSVVITVSVAGALNVYNKGNDAFPGTLLFTTAVIPLNTWTRVDIGMKYSTSSPSNGFFAVYFNGTLAGSAQSVGKGTTGLNTTNQLHGSSKIGNGQVAAHNLEADFDDWICVQNIGDDTALRSGFGYDTISQSNAMNSGSHVYLVRPTGFAPGTDPSWSTAKDWRTLNDNPNAGSAAANFLASTVPGATLAVTSDYSESQQGCPAFTVDAYTPAGVGSCGLGATTGSGGLTLNTALMAANGWAKTVISVPNSQALPLPLLTSLSPTFVKDPSGTSVTVQVLMATAEIIGTWMTADDPTQTYVADAGSHLRPYPTLLASKSGLPPINNIKITAGLYTGIGIGQDVLPLLTANWWFVRPVSGATNGVFWFSSCEAAQAYLDAIMKANRMGQALLDGKNAGKATMRLCGGADAASNANGVNYQFIAIEDTGSRFMLNGAFDHVTGLASAVNALHDPAFTPIAAFFLKETFTNAGQGSYYKGPGHAANEGSPLNALANAATAAFGAGSITSKSILHTVSTSDGQAAYSAWRKVDASGVSAKWFDVTSYVGNGAGGTRNIAVDIGEFFPLFAIVVPHNGISFFKDPSHTATQSWHFDGTNDAATGIVGGGANFITIGTALNTNLITYDVFVLSAPCATGAFTNPVDSLGNQIVCTPLASTQASFTACPVVGTGTVGVAFSATIIATGGVLPLLFTVTAGGLPTGLSLNSATGVISGTPTAAGVFPYTITITDAINAQVGVVVCSITIAAAGNTGTCPGVAGIVGTPYASSITATGGTPPYTFALTGGAFPNGLALNAATGLVSGTPTLAGVFPFQVTITDSLAVQIAVINCSITIAIPSVSTGCISFSQAITELSNRLGDQTLVHWTFAEVQLYLLEALRVYNALTNTARDRESFVATAALPFYDLPTVIPLLRSYNLKDVDLITLMEYHMIEPPTPAAWTGTPMFILDDITQALQRRLDRFLWETGCTLTRELIANVTPDANGRVPLSLDVFNLRRAAWVDGGNNISVIQRDDEWGFNAYGGSTWPTPAIPGVGATPFAYSIGVTPPLVIQLAPPPTVAGTLDLVSVTRSATLAPATGVLLGIPDDYAWVVKFGALADILGGPGPSVDGQRAAICTKLWDLGVKAARSAAVVLNGRVNGVTLHISSLSDADQFFTSWQNNQGAPANGLLASHNLIALVPVPDGNGPYTVTLDVVRNQPIPINLGDCYFEGGVQLTNALLDYAQFLALFKEGPSQADAAQALLQSFLEECQMGEAVDQAFMPNRGPVLEQTKQDERVVPRIRQPESQE